MPPADGGFRARERLESGTAGSRMHVAPAVTPERDDGDDVLDTGTSETTEQQIHTYILVEAPLSSHARFSHALARDAYEVAVPTDPPGRLWQPLRCIFCVSTDTYVTVGCSAKRCSVAGRTTDRAIVISSSNTTAAS